MGGNMIDVVVNENSMGTVGAMASMEIGIARKMFFGIFKFPRRKRFEDVPVEKCPHEKFYSHDEIETKSL